jgi:hypothetical protein
MRKSQELHSAQENSSNQKEQNASSERNLLPFNSLRAEEAEPE